MGLKPRAKTTARLGQVRCNQRIWGISGTISQQMILSSKSAGFRALAAEIAKERVAQCGSARCGSRLWPNETATHKFIAAKPEHQTVRAETEILENLLPAQYVVDVRYQVAS